MFSYVSLAINLTLRHTAYIIRYNGAIKPKAGNLGAKTSGVVSADILFAIRRNFCRPGAWKPNTGSTSIAAFLCLMAFNSLLKSQLLHLLRDILTNKVIACLLVGVHEFAVGWVIPTLPNNGRVAQLLLLFLYLRLFLLIALRTFSFIDDFFKVLSEHSLRQRSRRMGHAIRFVCCGQIKCTQGYCSLMVIFPPVLELS